HFMSGSQGVSGLPYITCAARSVTIRKMRGMTLAKIVGGDRGGRIDSTNSLDRTAGLRSRDRARHVPARVVGRGLSRPLPDNTASGATWLDAGKPSRGGDLTRKRSFAQGRPAVPLA